TLPEGMAAAGSDPSARLVQQSIGDVEGQGSGSRTFELIALAGPESVKQVAMAFRYQLADGAAGPPFQKTAETDVPIGAPAIALNFAVPQKVFGGQNFDIGLSYRNNSGATFQETKLLFDYPQNFQFVRASSSPSAGNNEWNLGDLPPNGQGEVTVTGAASGVQSLTVGVHLQVMVQGQRYDLPGQTATISLSASPLSLSIVANHDPAYIASLGEKVTYTLSYRNNSSLALQNIVIQAALDGAMFDIGSLQSPATLDSVQNTLTWNTTNVPALATVAPGAGGSVEFNIGLQKKWPIREPRDKNFAIGVKGNIRSLSVPPGITADQTVSAAAIATKVAGQTDILSTVYFREPEAAVVNSGPYPPQADQATQYTV